MTEEEKKLKTANLDEDVWEVLQMIKIKNKLKKMNDVVRFILKNQK